MTHVNLEEVVSKNGVVNKWHQIGASLSATFGIVSTGAAIVSSSYIMPQLEKGDGTIKISQEEGSWFASILMAGSLLGSLCGGLQSDFLGRRRSVLLDNLLFLIAEALIVFAPNFPIMLVGRAILGYAASTAWLTAPIYISEVSQPKIRGFTSSFVVISFSSGFAITSIFGAIFPWRILVYILMSIPTMGCISMFFCPETPVWLFRKNRLVDLNKSLHFLRGDCEVIKDEISRLELNRLQTTKELECNEQSRKDKMLRLFKRPELIKPVLLCSIMIILGIELSGFPAMAFYMVSILQRAELPISPYAASAYLTIFRSVLSMLMSGFVKNIARRKVIFAGGSLVGMSTLSIGVFSYLSKNTDLLEIYPWLRWTPLVFFSLMYLAFSSGYATVIFMAPGELLPADMRSFASGFVSFFDSLVVFMVVKTLPSVVDAIELHGLFWMYSGITFTLMLILFFTMPETHGLSLEEIENRFRFKETKMNTSQGTDQNLPI